MSNRVFYAVLGAVSLFLGGLLYIVFRENTYIARMFEEFSIVEALRRFACRFESGFIKYYFQDFLWAVSLNLELFAVSQPGLRWGIFCSAVTFIFGTLWELLQFFKILNGTGDICDVIMYFMAVVFALIIFIKKEKIK